MRDAIANQIERWNPNRSRRSQSENMSRKRLITFRNPLPIRKKSPIIPTYRKNLSVRM